MSVGETGVEKSTEASFIFTFVNRCQSRRQQVTSKADEEKYIHPVDRLRIPQTSIMSFIQRVSHMLNPPPTHCPCRLNQTKFFILRTCHEHPYLHPTNPIPPAPFSLPWTHKPTQQPAPQPPTPQNSSPSHTKTVSSSDPSASQAPPPEPPFPSH